MENDLVDAAKKIGKNILKKPLSLLNDETEQLLKQPLQAPSQHAALTAEAAMQKTLGVAKDTSFLSQPLRDKNSVPSSSHSSPSADGMPVYKSQSQAPIDNRPWTLQDIGQNAIAAVLNDPTSSGLGQKLDTVSKQALTAIPKTNLKHVKMSDFEPYIKEIKPHFDRYLECQNLMLKEDEYLLFSKNSSGRVTQTSKFPSPEKDQSSVISSFARGIITNAKINSSSLKKEALELIPSTFFDAEFTLENPRIFELVTENANVASSVPSIGDKSGGTTNSVIQEKMAHYLDTVEVHLVAEISRRSAEFFSALENIQSLHEETLQCLEHIRDIRSSLTNVSNEQAKKGLELVRLKQRRNNICLLYDSIRMVKDVKGAQPMIQILLNQSDYVGALDLIVETNKVLRSGNKSAQSGEKSLIPQKDRVVNLNGVRGLIHLSGQLAEMSKMIGTLMENDLVSLLVSSVQQALSKSQDPNQPAYQWAYNLLHSESSAFTNVAKTPIFNDADVQTKNDVKLKVLPLVMGLVRIERLGPALQIYRDKLTKVVKAVTKQFFPPSLPEEKDTATNQANAESVLQKRFRAMSFDDFFNMLSSVFLVLLQLQRQVLFLNEVIVSVLQEVEQRGIAIGYDNMIASEAAITPITPATKQPLPNDSTVNNAPITRYSQYSMDSADILYGTSDLAHVRCGKLLTLRGEQTSQLNFKDFHKMFEMIWVFVSTGEQICQRTCIGLRGTLMTQAKSFLNYFHMERTKQLTMLVDNEQWMQAEVPIDFQQMVNKITKNFTDGPLKTSKSPNSAHLADLDIASNLIDNGADKSKDDDEPLQQSNPNMQMYLMVKGKPYHVVPSSLLFVKMLDEYVTCATSMSSIANDILNRLLEIIKFFNTRVCGCIVGGAAVQNGALKSITAKHLSLASQSLGFMIALIPLIKLVFETVLPVKQQILLGEFDRIFQDYKNNQEQVHSRIVMIMQERLLTHCEGIPSTRWDSDDKQLSDNTATTTDPDPSPYMKNLVKETVKLHRILTRYIEADLVKDLFTKIFEIYNRQLETLLSKLELYTSAGKNRVLADVQYYIKVLSSLDFIDGPGAQLEVVVNNIPIKEKRERTLAQPQSAPTVPKPPVVSGSGQQTTAGPVKTASSTSIMGAEAAAAQAKKFGAAFTSGLGGLGKLMSKTELPTFGVKSTTTAPVSKANSSATVDKPLPKVSKASTGNVHSELIKEKPASIDASTNSLGASSSAVAEISGTQATLQQTSATVHTSSSPQQNQSMNGLVAITSSDPTSIPINNDKPLTENKPLPADPSSRVPANLMD